MRHKQESKNRRKLTKREGSGNSKEVLVTIAVTIVDFNVGGKM